MKFSVLSTAFLATTALGATTTYKTVVADIIKLHSDLVAFNSTLAGLTQGLTAPVGLVQVKMQTTTVEDQTKQTITDVNASPKFGQRGSTHVAVKLGNLAPLIVSVLNTTISKKPFFDDPTGLGTGAGSQSSTVLASLKTQHAQSDQLGAAVLKKVDKSIKQAAPFIQAQIDAAFVRAIGVYSS